VCTRSGSTIRRSQRTGTGCYRRELGAEHARQTGPVTILYAARDREHNNVIVLAELLRTGES
jgi:uncharacterized protein YeaO (DUF488 family)